MNRISEIMREIRCSYTEAKRIAELEAQSSLAATHDSACPHLLPQAIGHTGWGMADCAVQWCPACGAWRKSMLNWREENGEWNLPHDRTDNCARHLLH